MRSIFRKKPYEKKDFHQIHEDRIFEMFTIIREHGQIVSYDLQTALRLSPSKFYLVQRDCLQQNEKILHYDKKEHVYSYAYAKALTRMELSEKCSKLEREITV